MFIAVISEGFAVAEEQKLKEQVRALVNRSSPQMRLTQWYSKLNPYKYQKPKPKLIAVGNLPANMMLPMRKSVVRDLMMPRDVNGDEVYNSSIRSSPALLTHSCTFRQPLPRPPR